MRCWLALCLMLRAWARAPAAAPLRALLAGAPRTQIRLLQSGGGGSNERDIRAFARHVRQSLPPLSEMLSYYEIDMTRTGSRTMARCPFHKGGMEANPSMSINDEMGVYNCFTCGASGNTLTFVQDLEDLTYGETLRELAERYDIDGADGLDGRALAAADAIDAAWTPTPLPEDQQRLVEANEAATRFYLATRKTRQAEACAAMLRERGVTNTVAEKFGLGFAPDGWNGLATHLRTSTDVTAASSVAAGLCGRSDEGKIFDRFRDRLIIPIHDPYGRLVALGGRTIEGGDDSPQVAKGRKGSLNFEQLRVEPKCGAAPAQAVPAVCHTTRQPTPRTFDPPAQVPQLARERRLPEGPATLRLPPRARRHPEGEPRAPRPTLPPTLTPEPNP